MLYLKVLGTLMFMDIKKNKKLSIITINLNNAQGLLKTIKSVISQTCPDFEYIIIDGGSSDGSIDIIRSFTIIPPGNYVKYSDFKYQTHNTSNKNPISYWISEQDNGIYHAMNKGIQVAQGEYCQFLNSGDCLTAPDVIEKLFAFLPDCSIFYGNMLKQMPKGKVYRDTCEKGNLTMLSFYRGSLNHSPAFIKRSLFEKYGLYDESLKIVSDWKWYLIAIVLHNEPVRYVDLDVAYFDMNGISNTNYGLNQNERHKVLQELLPVSILSDYDAHWQKIEQGNRINRYKITRIILWVLDRMLFKWEKIVKK